MTTIIQHSPVPEKKAQRALITEEEPLIFLINNQIIPIFL